MSYLTATAILRSAREQCVCVCVPVQGEVIQLNVGVDGIGLTKVQQFLQSLVDENDADESSERFLCETCDVTHQRACIGCHQHYTEERRPQSDTGPQGQVGHPVIPNDTKVLFQLAHGFVSDLYESKNVLRFYWPQSYLLNDLYSDQGRCGF